MHQTVIVVQVVKNTTAGNLGFDATKVSCLKPQETATQNLSYSSHSYSVCQTDNKMITSN